MDQQGERNLTYLLSLISVALVVAMVIYPETAFQAAVKGLEVWWNVVFPALLPFFIGAQVLMGLGVVHFMGVLLEPFMRPLFNVPGTGSFVMAMGLASGYPIGSVLTARLRREKLLSKAEAERLMSFTNTADPLFMSGAVAVGMFGNAALSGVIMLAHYLSSILTGLLLRFYAPNAPITENEPNSKPLLRRAFGELVRAREQDGRPFGQLLGDCVRTSINTLLLIGGFIILFSVTIKILTAVGFVAVMARMFSQVLGPLGVDTHTSAALVSGFFEITLGTQLAAQVSAPLMHQVIVASVIIAWAGMSVHAQVAAMLEGTDLTMGPYMLSRVFHAVAAGAITALLWPIMYRVSSLQALPVFWGLGRNYSELGFVVKLAYASRTFVYTCVLLTATAAVLYAARALHVLVFWFGGSSDRPNGSPLAKK